MTDFYDPNQNDSSSEMRNYVLSLVVHGLIFALSSYLPNPMVPLDEGTIEIEYIASGPLNYGAQTRVAKPVAKAVQPKTITKEVVIEKPEAIESKLEVEDLEVPIAAEMVDTVEKDFVSNESFDDIPTPELETAQLETPSLVDSAIADIDAEMQRADRELEQELEAEEKALAAQQVKAKAMQQKLALQQKASADALSKAQLAASKKKAAAALAKQKAERQRALAAARAKRGQQQAALERAKKAKAGAAAAFGTPTGVRDLKDFKQYPGNPRPSYSSEDRYQKKQGMVVFLAYVSETGELVNFKLKTSSKHRTLDIRTLKALKKWRFYPGQQGWVELPFKWNLKGDAQEYPSGLRRSLGQN